MDAPFLAGYVISLKNLFTGDLGIDLDQRRPVLEVLGADAFVGAKEVLVTYAGINSGIHSLNASNTPIVMAIGLLATITFTATSALVDMVDILCATRSADQPGMTRWLGCSGDSHRATTAAARACASR